MVGQIDPQRKDLLIKNKKIKNPGQNDLRETTFKKL